MRTMEWRTTDKTAWGSGPWQDEPDKRQWQDEATGLACLIVRNPGGSLCGYVGVPQGHPDHGKDYASVDVEVHGGLTFADTCTPITPDAFDRMRQRVQSSQDEARRYPVGDAAQYIREWSPVVSFDAFKEKAQGHYICHLPEPGESDDVWWLGFDCAHLGDHTPSFDHARRDPHSTYKGIGYVEREVRSLAKQLAARA